MSIATREAAQPKPPVLRTWAELTEELTLPAGVAMAVATSRPELLKAVTLTPDDGPRILELVRVLLETNQELQRHAAVLSQKLENIVGTLRGLGTQLRGAADFAAFRQGDEDSEEISVEHC